MAELEELFYSAGNLPQEGDHVRVRPEPTRPVSYGQGAPLAGPRLQDVQFVWGGALLVDSSCANGIGDPESGRIHPDTIAQTPELFLSEANYQSLNSEE